MDKKMLQDIADLQRRVNDLFDALEQRSDKMYALRCKIDRLRDAGQALCDLIDHDDPANHAAIKAWNTEVPW